MVDSIDKLCFAFVHCWLRILSIIRNRDLNVTRIYFMPNETKIQQQTQQQELHMRTHLLFQLSSLYQNKNNFPD